MDWSSITDTISGLIPGKTTIVGGIVALIAGSVAVIGKLIADWRHDKQQQQIGARAAQDEAQKVQDIRVENAQKAGDAVGNNVAGGGLRADDGAKLPDNKSGG